MRHPFLLVVFLLLSPAAAWAQVTIDLRALDALPNTPPAVTTPRPVFRLAPHVAARPAPDTRAATATLSPEPVRPVLPTPPTPPVRPALPTVPSAPAVAAAPPSAMPPAVPPTGPAPPAATLPTAAPAVVALAPIPPPPAPATTASPPAPSVSATAATTATPDNTGLQLSFKAAESDLSPDANAAIGRLVKATPQGDTISYNVVAYASGTADDPSVARRTSLARGLAVRGALIAAGVPSTRIYVRALGSTAGDGPADRVDVNVMGLSGAAIPVKQ